MQTITRTINPHRSTLVRLFRDFCFHAQVVFFGLTGRKFLIKKRTRC